jgi:hypothetical protein
MDMMYDGEEAFSFHKLTRWSEIVLAAWQARPFNRLGLRGVNVPGDIGTLLLTEGGYAMVVITFPYASKAAMAAGLMPPGYRFPASILIGPDDFESLGTNPRAVDLTVQHLRAYDATTGNFECYDHFIPPGLLIN